MNKISTFKNLEDYPEILTAKMIADYLGIGYTKALSLIQHSGISYLKLGNTYRVPRATFHTWLLQPQNFDPNLIN